MMQLGNLLREVEVCSVSDEVFTSTFNDFLKNFYSKLHYVFDKKIWIVSEGGIYRNLSKDEILSEINKILLRNFGTQKLNGGKFTLETFFKRYSVSRLTDAILSFFKTKDGVLLDFESVNNHEGLIALKNGVINLDDLSSAHSIRDVQLHKHPEQRFLTETLDFEYDPNANAENFLNFLYDIFQGDDHKISFLKKAIGYAIDPSIDLNLIFFFIGVGSNGKSTLVNVVHDVLNIYSSFIDPSSFFTKNISPTRNELARLFGKRIVFSPELPARAIDTRILKNISGGDKIVARFLFSEFFEFTPRFKLFFSTNTTPKFEKIDFALKRRLAPLQFTKIITPKSQIPNLAKTLLKEKAGIFNFFLDGLLEVKKAIVNNINPFESLIEIDLVSSIFQANDIVSAIIIDNFEASPYSTLSLAEITSFVNAMLTEAGHPEVSSRAVSNCLQNLGLTKKKTNSGVVFYIKRKSDESEEW